MSESNIENSAIEKKGLSLTVKGLLWVLLFFSVASVFWLLNPRVDPRISDFSDAYAYGFEGYPMPYGDELHSIYRGDGISVEVAERFGDYLEHIDYFTSDYRGIVQLKQKSEGYEAYLTYRMEYWDSPEFIEEVGNLEEDLEKFVLMKPVSLIVLDENENGVHQRTLR